MKKHSTKAISKKVFALLVSSVVFFGTVQNSYAASGRTEQTVKGVEISYKGMQDNLLVFNVDYKNELGKAFQLVIRNEQNEVLFIKKYDAKPLNTSIRLSTPPEDCKITMSIETGKKEFVKTFEIASKVETVEEFVVKGI